MTSPKLSVSQLGEIPEDWEIKKLESIAPLQRGFDLPKKKQKKGAYPVVYSNGICTYHNEYMVKGPGVVTGRSGTIGHIHYVEQNFWPHNTALWVTKFYKNSPKFIYYLFQSFDWQPFSTGSGVPTLNRNFVHEKLLPIPKEISEQNKIASVLSDTDELLTTLEELIEKKRNIKQGVLQELLSGNIRLPGFKGPWNKKTILEITGKIKRGQTLKSDDFRTGNVPVVAGGKQYAGYHNVSNQTGRTITVSGSGASAGFVAIHNIPIFATDCSVIKESDSFSLDYLYYHLVYIQDSLYGLQTGGAQPHVYPRDIEKIAIQIPDSIKEQKAISKILIDVDNDISILEERLAKYQAIKQGMMQQLLTGKIRLV